MLSSLCAVNSRRGWACLGCAVRTHRVARPKLRSTDNPTGSIPGLPLPVLTSDCFFLLLPPRTIFFHIHKHLRPLPHLGFPAVRARLETPNASAPDRRDVERKCARRGYLPGCVVFWGAGRESGQRPAVKLIGINQVRSTCM